MVISQIPKYHCPQPPVRDIFQISIWYSYSDDNMASAKNVFGDLDQTDCKGDTY